MLYMEDAVRATIELMDAPAAAITERGSYNLAGVTFTPAELFGEIRRHHSDFTMTCVPDYRQKIAEGWPDSIDDTLASHDWGWQPRFGLSDIVADMLANILAHTEPR